MGSIEERRRTFDEVAEQYDRYRPGYPEPLVDDVVRWSGIAPRGHILEIGCGTGQATMPFARRGYRLTCIEPGRRLAELAVARTADFDVHVDVCTFEQWRPTARDFDLVMAAQSFHFVDPVGGLEKAGELLRPGGAIAIFGNEPQRGDSERDRHIQAAYAAHAPGLGESAPDTPLEDRIDAAGCFETVLMARYPWRATYTSDEYVGLMGTQSHHRLLPPEQREALLRSIGEAIAGHGGTITIDYVARLYLARRRAGPPRA